MRGYLEKKAHTLTKSTRILPLEPYALIRKKGDWQNLLVDVHTQMINKGGLRGVCNGLGTKCLYFVTLVGMNKLGAQ